MGDYKSDGKFTRAWRGCFAEALERRTLLTVLCEPFFGPEPTRQTGDTFLKNSPVFMLFWGSFWNDHPEQVGRISDAAAGVVTSEYPQVVNQYGADGGGMSLGGTLVDGSEPGTAMSLSRFNDVIDHAIDGPFPDADQGSFDGGPHAPIYCVVTPPGTGFPGALGFNTNDGDRPEIWCSSGGSADGTINLDAFTTVFGHEVVEVMSDFKTDGFEVNAGPQAPGDSDNEHQIADYEAIDYLCRPLGAGLVQAVWSRDDQAFIVRDGNRQLVTLTPHRSNGSFTGSTLFIKGDQMAFSSTGDDAVTVSTNAFGEIEVILDGEFYRFPGAKITQMFINLGTGNNTVDLGGLTKGLPIAMNAIGGHIDLRGPALSSVWNVTGPNFGNLKFGNADAAAFADVRSIVGSPAGDKFVFHDGGAIFGDVDGNGAVTGTSNSFDYSQCANPVEVDLIRHRASNVGGIFSHIGRITGGSSPSDTFIASDADWEIFGPDAGAAGGSAYASFENLRGGDGDDTFRFLSGGSVSGNVDGGAGSNTLDYAATAGPVTVDFNTGTASLIGGTFTNIQNAVGSGNPNDVIIGPDALWVIDAANGGSVNAFKFSSFENLVGSDDLDTFTFMPGGSVSGNVDGGAGVNTLDYSHLATPVTVNLSAHTATGIGGTFSGISGIVGSAGGTNVVGPDAPTTWTVTGRDAVSAFGFSFTGTSSLTGGAADDTFVVQNGGSLSGRIDGGGGDNSLVYANNFTGDVVVNLRLKSATALGAGVYNMRHVTAGGGGNCMLVGDDAANRLTAGAGRAVLVGSGGGDTLAGGDGDTILIGDRTAYDGNAAALRAIFAEWTRADASFQKRVSDLLSTAGGGLNGAYVLNKSTVFADGATDVLLRGDGQTWDILSRTDVLDDKEAGDHVTQV